MKKFLRWLLSDTPKETKELTFARFKEHAKQKEETANKAIGAKLVEYSKVINEYRQELRESIDALEIATLRNPNIPEKATQFMEGNRTAYVKLTRIFERDVMIASAASDIPLAVLTMNESLNRLALSTARSYAILQQFFANEAAIVAENIRKIAVTYEQIKKDYDEYKIPYLMGVQEKIMNIETHTKTVSDKKTEYAKEKSHLKQLEEEYETREKELALLRQSQEYLDYVTSQELAMAENQQMQQYERMFQERISTLDKPLKKLAYRAFEEEKLIGQYLSNPVQALVHDYDLRIIKTFEKLKMMIEKGQIEVEEKRRDKIFATIAELTSKSLAKFLHDYNSQAKRVAITEASVLQNAARQQEAEIAAAYKQRGIELQAKKRAVEALEQGLESLEIAPLINTIEQEWDNQMQEKINILLE